MTDLSKLVRPLVWEATNDKRDGRTHYGHGVFTHWYAVYREKTGAWSAFHFLSSKRTGIYSENGDTFPTLDAAKAAAQADYEARILAAIDTEALGELVEAVTDATKHINAEGEGTVLIIHMKRLVTAIARLKGGA